MSALACFYNKGLGVQADKDLARSLLDKAESHSADESVSLKTNGSELSSFFGIEKKEESNSNEVIIKNASRRIVRRQSTFDDFMDSKGIDQKREIDTKKPIQEKPVIKKISKDQPEQYDFNMHYERLLKLMEEECKRVNLETSKIQSSGVITEITIPEGIISIPDYFFANRYRLETISLPDTIRAIGDSAFENCISLKSITFPRHLKAIGNRCFFGCRKLETLVLPDELERIGVKAFSDCYCLKDVTFPRNTTRISNEVFANCKNLHNLLAEGDGLIFGDSVFLNCLNVDCYPNPINKFTIRNGLLVYCKDVLKAVDTSILSVSIEYGFRKVHSFAFRDCTNLEYLELPRSMRYVGEQAFKGCYNIKNIVLRSNIEFGAEALGLGTEGHKVECKIFSLERIKLLTRCGNTNTILQNIVDPNLTYEWHNANLNRTVEEPVECDNFCPRCGSRLKMRPGRYDGSWFLVCPHQSCEFRTSIGRKK